MEDQRIGTADSNALVSGAILSTDEKRHVEMNRPVVEAGLSALDAGDLADGVIACEGESLEAGDFASFASKVVSLRQSTGPAAPGYCYSPVAVRHGDSVSRELLTGSEVFS